MRIFLEIIVVKIYLNTLKFLKKKVMGTWKVFEVTPPEFKKRKHSHINLYI